MAKTKKTKIRSRPARSPELITKFKDVLPRPSPEEFAALKASDEAGIRERDPILTDEDGAILDGFARYSIDENWPRKIVKGLKTDAEKIAFIFQVNFSRRNLTPAQKRQIAIKMRDVARNLRKQDKKKFTNKVVAGMLGVAESSVARWFKTGTNLQVQDSSQSPRSFHPAEVKISSMPQGVEHRHHPIAHATVPQVKISSMPQGVEHMSIVENTDVMKP